MKIKAFYNGGWNAYINNSDVSGEVWDKFVPRTMKWWWKHADEEDWHNATNYMQLIRRAIHEMGYR